MKPEDREARFWSHVDKSGDCWEWQGALNRGGYGKVTWRYKTVPAHRVSWFLTHSDWPSPGLNVCHSCDNRKCVRPEHLFLGTQKDNIHDMIAKGRGSWAKGETKNFAKLTEAQVLEIRRLYRKGGDLLQKDIAEMFGVESSLISMITTRRIWKHI